MDLSPSSASLPACTFFLTNTLMLVNDYWLWFDFPDHLHYPDCPACRYKAYVELALDPDENAEDDKLLSLQKHLFDISANDIIKHGSLVIPPQDEKLEYSLEMSSDRGMRLLSSSKVDIFRFNSHNMILEDPMGLIWCKNTTTYNKIQRDPSQAKNPPVPDDCQTDVARYTARNGAVDLGLKGVPIKVGSTSQLFVYVMSRTYDVSCSVTLSKTMMEFKRGGYLSPRACAFGLMTVGLTITSDVEEKILNDQPFYVIDLTLHLSGLHQDLLINYLYVQVSHREETDARVCVKFENLGFVADSFGTALNVPAIGADVEIDEVTRSGVFTVEIQGNRASYRQLAAVAYRPDAANQKCVCAYPPLGGEAPGATCPSCEWLDDRLSVTYKDLQPPFPEENYLFLITEKNRRAWKLTFSQSQKPDLDPTINPTEPEPRPSDHEEDPSPPTNPPAEILPPNGGEEETPPVLPTPGEQPTDPTSENPAHLPEREENSTSPPPEVHAETPEKPINQSDDSIIIGSTTEAPEAETEGASVIDPTAPKPDKPEENTQEGEDPAPSSPDETPAPPAATPTPTTPTDGPSGDTGPNEVSETESSSPNNGTAVPETPESEGAASPDPTTTTSYGPDDASPSTESPSIEHPPLTGSPIEESNSTQTKPPTQPIPENSTTNPTAESPGEPTAGPAEPGNATESSTARPSTASPEPPSGRPGEEDQPTVPSPDPAESVTSPPTPTPEPTPSEVEIHGERKFWSIPLFVMLGSLCLMFVFNIIFCVYTNRHPRIRYTMV